MTFLCTICQRSNVAVRDRTDKHIFRGACGSCGAEHQIAITLTKTTDLSPLELEGRLNVSDHNRKESR